MENNIESYELKINNKRIFDFYKNNSALNFENINLLCIELFEHILQNNSTEYNNILSRQILEKCLENNNKIEDINKNMMLMNNNISKLGNELIMKFIDIKKDYIDEVKNIIIINSAEKFEKLMEFIEKNNSIIIDKTIINNNLTSSSITNKLDDKFTLLISSINNNIMDKINSLLNKCIPENNEQINKQIQDEFQHFFSLIMEETKKKNTEDINIVNSFIKSYNEQMTEQTKDSKEFLHKQDEIINKLNKENSLLQVENFISTFETKYNSLLQTIQKPIFDVLNNNEEKIIKSISRLKDSNNEQKYIQDKLFNNMEDFLNRYKNNSSSKGKYSEQHLKRVLEQIEGSNIIDNSELTSCGDLLLIRENKPSIIFENKEYNNTIPTSEVDKFIYDCNKQKSHGIFLSQSSGIALKRNYQIEIIQKRYILVYVCHVEYLFEKIKIAIDIIDSLSEKIDEHIGSLPAFENDEFVISKELLDEINDEFNKVITQKETIINLVKDFQKKIIISVDDIKLPSIEKCIHNFIPVQPIIPKFICSKCNVFVAKSKSSLTAHYRWCNKNIQTDVINESVTTTPKKLKKSIK